VKGERRGFYIVEDGKPKFMDLTAFEGIYREIDATGMGSSTLNERLKEIVKEIDVKDRVVVIKVFGELTRGKTSEVEFASMREEIMRRGAICLHLNRSQLRSREFEGEVPVSDDIQKIEQEAFKEFAKTRTFTDPKLNADAVSFSMALLNQLRVQKKEGETEADYERRIVEAGIEVLGIKDLLKG
ncbi:MAG: hypothetical protein ACUVQ5_03835, partial [Candidatus Methanomethylicaceae archaeon]